MYNQQLADRITQFLQENSRYYTAAEIAQALNVKADLDFYYVINTMLWCEELWLSSNKGIKAYKYRELSTVIRCAADLFPSECKVS